jgi:hypothetical protein
MGRWWLLISWRISERKWLRISSRYYPSVWMEGLRKSMKYRCPENWPPVWYSKRRPSQYEAQVLLVLRHKGQFTLFQMFLSFVYEEVSKSFRTDRLERELQIVHHSATRCSRTAVFWISLVSFAAITLCVASQRVFIDVVYFVVNSVRKLLDTPSYKNNLYKSYTHTIWQTYRTGKVILTDWLRS